MTKVMPIDDYSDIVADEMPRLKVLLVDDHTLFRESLQFILGKCEDITVVGQAGDGYEALDKVRTLKPDVVLLDINMPKLNGIDTLKEIKRIAPETLVIILTMHSTRHFVHEALTHRANGYVLKDFASGDLIPAIRAAVKGDVYISPAISSTEAGIPAKSVICRAPMLK